MYKNRKRKKIVEPNSPIEYDNDLPIVGFNNTTQNSTTQNNTTQNNTTQTYSKEITNENNLTNEEKEYEMLNRRLINLKNEHENLLIRIVGVSDELLRDQLQTDCMMLEDAISLLLTNIKDAEYNIMCGIIYAIKIDHISFYQQQFIESDPITCVEKTNNINIISEIKKRRMRIPTSLSQKRELCIIANEMNIKIILVDYEGFYLDYIGKGTSMIKLICNCFKRFKQDPTSAVYLMD